jgi:hypothetical protein
LKVLIASVVDRYLGRRGAYLPPHLREDLDAYLLADAWRLYKRFDPSKASTPLSLSTFLTRRLTWSVTNWFRETFTDSRYRRGLLVDVFLRSRIASVGRATGRRQEGRSLWRKWRSLKDMLKKADDEEGDDAE